MILSYPELFLCPYCDNPMLCSLQTGEAATLDAFKQQFDGVSFHKGTEIVFVQEGSKLVTKIDGVQRGSISSPSLCRSLFDIYLGTDPVAPEAKTTFGKSLAAVFKK